MSKRTRVTIARSRDFEIIADGGVFLPRVMEDALIAPPWMIRLDLEHGILGDLVAGAFLVPYDQISEGLRPLVMSYRSSVLREEKEFLASFMGDALPLVGVSKGALVVLRMLRLWGRFGHIYRRCLEEPTALSYAEDVSAGEIRRLFWSLWVGRVDKEELIERFLGLAADMKLVSRGFGETEIGLSRRAMKKIESIVGKEFTCRRTGLIYSTYLCEGPHGRVVMKDYGTSAVKWVPATLVSAPVARYRTDPRERAVAEVLYSAILRRVIRTPKMLFLGLGKDIVTIREYVIGAPLILDPRQDSWERAGRALAEIHDAGYALGDANPGNFVISDEVSVIDLEQTRRASDREKLWDIATLLIYSNLMSIRCKLIDSFLESYLYYVKSPLIAKNIEMIERLAPCGVVPPRFPDVLEIIKKRIS